MEVTLTPSQDQSGITTKLWRNHPEQTTEQYTERSLRISDRQKNQLQYNLTGKECSGDLSRLAGPQRWQHRGDN